MPFSSFTFEPVGQGLFIHGRLQCPGLAELRIVFDCGLSGMQARLNDCIHEYKSAFVGPDVLILSHLHEDHVSGVPTLLRGHTCEAVVLPYLSPLARAAVAAATEDPGEDFLDLLADPISFFLGGDEPRARRLIFVTDGEGRPGDRSGDEAPVSPENDRPRGDPDARTRMIKNLEREFLGAGRAANPNDDLGSAAKLGAVRVLQDDRSLRLTPCWTFRFFVRDPLKGTTASARADAWSTFEAKVRVVLGIPTGPISTAVLAAALKDPEKIQALGGAYRSLGNLNTNGLSLWVGRRLQGLGRTMLAGWSSPFVGCSGGETAVWVGRSTMSGKVWRNVIDGVGFTENSGTGVLFTGDANLQVNGREMLAHYSAELPSTGTVQIPHHGSRLSWDDGVFLQMVQVMGSPSFWPVNAGLLNKYAHPHRAVLKAIEGRFDAILAPNHEHASVTLQIRG